MPGKTRKPKSRESKPRKTASLAQTIKQQIASTIEVIPEGRDRYTILTPLSFDDGDALPITLKRERDDWWLSDEGGSLMHLSYEVDEQDLRKGPRREIIDRTVEAFSMENRRGELRLRINGQGYGPAICDFLHALVKIDDIRFLSRERARSAFFTDFQHLIETKVPESRRQADWHHPLHDPKGHYPVDYRVNGRSRPLFLFALPSVARINVATISVLKLKLWNVPGEPVGIFDDQDKIPTAAAARFLQESAVSFPSLDAAARGLPKRFPDILLPSAH